MKCRDCKYWQRDEPSPDEFHRCSRSAFIQTHSHVGDGWAFTEPTHSCGEWAAQPGKDE
jgi:hypothetical protein